MSARARIGAAAAACLLAAGCGSTKLEEGDANEVVAARHDLHRAVATTRELEDPARARALVRSVSRTLGAYQALRGAGRSLGSELNSSFNQGLAQGALDEVAKDVPSLVIGGPGLGGSLDVATTKDFLRYARAKPPRAIHGPASFAVRELTTTLDGKPAGASAPALHGIDADDLLRSAAAEARPLWPDLAARLDRARGSLG
jgi:hypothetical protein